jgi:hypothetical protein
MFATYQWRHGRISGRQLEAWYGNVGHIFGGDACIILDGAVVRGLYGRVCELDDGGHTSLGRQVHDTSKMYLLSRTLLLLFLLYFVCFECN